MALPFDPPIEPMLAKPADAIPRGDYLYEPKWDGFRAIVFRDGPSLTTQSRDRKPLDRYFPELAAPLLASLPPRCVVDGEVILIRDGALDFEALQQRIHPAASRVERLAEATPAAYIAFDVLALGEEDLRSTPQAERRARLEHALAGARPPVWLTPATRDAAQARRWFDELEGAGLDGILAKPLVLGYAPGKRVLTKVKHIRSADCVVAGFRWHQHGEGTEVGSLLLGLYDADGLLHHVGVAASFSAARRRELAALLEPLREGALEGHPWRAWAEMAHSGGQRVPGGLSRWSAGKDPRFEPVRCERVCEVKYDFMAGDRFRHATTFLRWRTDKPLLDCSYDQLDTPTPFDLAQFLRA